MSSSVILLLETDRAVIRLVLIQHYMSRTADRMEQKSGGKRLTWRLVKAVYLQLEPWDSDVTVEKDRV